MLSLHHRSSGIQTPDLQKRSTFDAYEQKVVTISTSSAASKVHACSSAKPLSSKLSSASPDVRHREENLQSVVRFKPVVFMGETLTCPPGFLGGGAPVVSFSRYKFKAVRHCLCGIVFKYRTLGQLLQSIFTNSSLLPQKLQTWIQSKLVKKNMGPCFHYG